LQQTRCNRNPAQAIGLKQNILLARYCRAVD
jgi:hypothetical protein